MKLPKYFLVLSAAILYAAAFNAVPAFSQDVKGALEGPLETSEVEQAQISIMGGQPQNGNGPKFNAPVQVLTLDECIQIAVKNHLPLKTAKKNLKLAEWRLWEARRNMLPKVSFNWQEYTGKINGRRFFGKKVATDVQQTVFHGGEFLYTMKQAETNVKIVNREYARLRNDLVLQVKKGYYSFAKAKENLKLQSELSKEVSKIYEMVLKESDAGIASNLELLNVNSQMNQVRFQFTSAKGDVEVAELILKQAMNVDIREKVDVDTSLEVKKRDLDHANILKDAMVHRPEMQINSLMITYYMYETKVARSKSWPKIDLLGSFGMAKENYIAKDQETNSTVPGGNDDPDKMEQQWYAGVKCSLPLWGSTAEYSYTKEHWVPVVSAFHGTETITNSVKFNFLDNLAQYSDQYSSAVDLDRARQEFIKTKQDVTLEVKENCFNYEKALMQLDTASNKVKYQESDLELVKYKRQMDEAQDSNVIESMIKLAQEKFGYVQSMSDCQIAIAGLCKAVGLPDYFDREIESNNKK